ncbi:MAG: hypothetical protein OQK32_00135 [Gammaproteobacteria bacterium]|nr:hypothetical protein [Gammaproteobacteria bacterium]MCW8923111.1 hypothetical protein [Gammaproteobacteria bacterium]
MINLFGFVSSRSYLKGLTTVLLVFAVISCSDTDGDPEDIVGVAATGEATQGTVFIIDATGTEISKPINADGFFRFDVRGMTAPFMLKSVDSNGVDVDLFSYASKANVTANITPLTNLAVYMANGEADLSILYNSWVSSFVNIADTNIKNAQAVINANLSTQYTAFSLDPLTYDFFSTTFLTNSTSFDALLDALSVTLLPNIGISVVGVNMPLFETNIDVADFNIGGDSVAEIGAYTLTLEVTVDDAVSDVLTLSINLPVSSVPSPGNTQIVEDTFSTFYGSVGDIVINSVTVTIGEELETIAVINATITNLDDGDVTYIATYTYTQNI